MHSAQPKLGSSIRHRSINQSINQLKTTLSNFPTITITLHFSDCGTARVLAFVCGLYIVFERSCSILLIIKTEQDNQNFEYKALHFSKHSLNQSSTERTKESINQSAIPSDLAS